MKLMPIEIASHSDKGLVRDINEDTVAAIAEYGLVIVADGMGGYNAGEVASQLAVDTVSSVLLPMLKTADHAPLKDAVCAANETIHTAIERSPQFEGMGTTIVLGVFGDDRIQYAHVGDSRLYRYRSGRLDCLTKDHSVIQQMVDDGFFQSLQEAREAGVKNNMLTRGLGTDSRVEVDVAETSLEAEDLYLFCSDGLSNMVNDEEIEAVLSTQFQDIEAAAKRLLEMALERGGMDNVSLVVVRPALQ